MVFLLLITVLTLFISNYCSYVIKTTQNKRVVVKINILVINVKF